jgi:hypothetical protein
MMINTAKEKDIYERLVSMTWQTNVIALEKTLNAINSRSSLAVKAKAVGSIAEKIVRATHEVGMCLPEDQRAR